MKLTRVVAFAVMSLLTVGTASAQTYYTINLQAQSGHYVVAEQGGNDFVNADRGSAGAWETFELEDTNGGSLMSGDPVYIRTVGGYYFNATCFTPTARLGAMTVTTGWCSPSFAIEKYDSSNNYVSGAINSGDQVVLFHWSGYYTVAENGGGGVVRVNRTSVGAWEKFFITF